MGEQDARLMSRTELNADPQELARFEALAERWWNPDGPMKALHEINPLRLDYIDKRAPLQGARVLDVGCGAGLLSEGMTRRGAQVVGIDLAGGQPGCGRQSRPGSRRRCDIPAPERRGFGCRTA